MAHTLEQPAANVESEGPEGEWNFAGRHVDVYVVTSETSPGALPSLERLLREKLARRVEDIQGVQDAVRADDSRAV